MNDLIVYDVNDLMKILKVSRATVIRYINDKKIKAFKVGNSYRITKDALSEYIKEQEKS
ncbi:MAG: helix-turn-helix domain-containing protein [Acholeplasmataceae bacterium]|nr:helix-turn-helix domain-containing protein [Acholeplasmataceae bacterium]